MNYDYDQFKDDYDPDEDYIGREDELAFLYTLGGAFQGNAEQQYIMGYIYNEGGHGVKVDLQKAEFWFLKAAAGGISNAQCALGKLYSEGKLCKPDYEKALRYYLQAAQRGNFAAQTQAGVMLFEGKGAERDTGEAKYWLERGAKGGYAEAYYTLARIYAQDKKKYEENLRRAVSFNYAKAFTDLCVFYLNEGRLEAAREIYMRALKTGNGGAVKNFGGEFNV